MTEMPGPTAVDMGIKAEFATQATKPRYPSRSDIEDIISKGGMVDIADGGDFFYIHIYILKEYSCLDRMLSAENNPETSAEYKGLSHPL